jgi:quercetin dioxygenase-like cupin family protein
MAELQSTPQPDRLRTAPSERFAGPAHAFDLHSALSDLRAEDHPARDGHRQVTIFQQAPVTHVLFAFDRGGSLAEHSTNGLVTIQCLEGHIRVQANNHDYDLPAGQLLVLKPGVPHDVRAEEASAMLLTVHMQQESREG